MDIVPPEYWRFVQEMAPYGTLALNGYLEEASPAVEARDARKTKAWSKAFPQIAFGCYLFGIAYYESAAISAWFARVTPSWRAARRAWVVNAALETTSAPVAVLAVVRQRRRILPACGIWSCRAYGRAAGALPGALCRNRRRAWRREVLCLRDDGDGA